jgi:hypothetical protein
VLVILMNKDITTPNPLVCANAHTDVGTRVSGSKEGILLDCHGHPFNFLRRRISQSDHGKFYYTVVRDRSFWFQLVGIEPNPGPGKKKSSVTVVVKPKVSKPKVKEVVVRQAGVKNSPSQSFGEKYGAKVGSFIGDAAQRAIKAITGFGDYKVTSNSLYNGAMNSSSPPIFANRGVAANTVQLVKREYCQDILSVGSAFNITTFYINPTNPQLFAFLTAVSQNFEQFQFRGLVFEFNTTSATAIGSTNTALGSVILATQYNVNETPFTTKQEMDEYEFACSTNPSLSILHPVECAPLSGEVQVFFTSTSSDLNLANLGLFSIATVGQQAASNIGELWVSYDVLLMKPRLFYPVPQAVGYCELSVPQFSITPIVLTITDLFGNFDNGASIVSSGGVPGDPRTTGYWRRSIGSTLPILLGTVVSASANQIIFPSSASGTYLIVFYVQAHTPYNNMVIALSNVSNGTAVTSLSGAIGVASPVSSHSMILPDSLATAASVNSTFLCVVTTLPTQPSMVVTLSVTSVGSTNPLVSGLEIIVVPYANTFP